MAQQDDLYKESRDLWQDCNHRQEVEHNLINRKTTWSLTGQTLLFAAYGLSLDSKLADNKLAAKGSEFREVVAFSGLALAIVTLVGVISVINSKRLSWRQYETFYSSRESLLPKPHKTPLQWGVNTRNTVLTLAPEVLMPLIFLVAWIFLL